MQAIWPGPNNLRPRTHRCRESSRDNPEARCDRRVDAKKLLEPSRRAETVKALQQLGLSQREACKSAHARRRSSRESVTFKVEQDARVATRLTEVAQAHSEHGCRRLYNDYERDAIEGDEYMNYKRFRRILPPCRLADRTSAPTRSRETRAGSLVAPRGETI